MRKFEPINGPEGKGYAALTIYAPGEFMNEPRWMAFVGGSGIGDADSEAHVRMILEAGALNYCERQIAHAQAIIKHYSGERVRLLRDGLVEISNG